MRQVKGGGGGMLLSTITILATVAAGLFSASAFVIPLAALALMAEGVLAKAWELRQNPAVPVSTKMVTYLVMGGVGWLLVAWAAYVTGALLRGLA